MIERHNASIKDDTEIKEETTNEEKNDKHTRPSQSENETTKLSRNGNNTQNSNKPRKTNVESIGTENNKKNTNKSAGVAN
jgi:hypothetical protein